MLLFSFGIELFLADHVQGKIDSQHENLLLPDDGNGELKTGFVGVVRQFDGVHCNVQIGSCP